ncbi:TIGR02234 family membrane protein [Streptacidiphilus carbonis]|uniref:TIGR02234 family membrane protein n=1 Tax=Streptacidiphilus carbonis TaxID=105422 RepID=UPI0005A7E3B3|nr:TIGR02234 family membrane protein [Streptacidiphilus carbonis]
MTALPETEPTETEPTETSADDTPAAPAAPRRPDRRSLALMLLLTVLGAAVVLLAAGQTWAHGSVAFQGTRLKVSASGSETSGLPGALALVALAAAVAVFSVRGAARAAVGALLSLAGAGVAASALVAATGVGALNGKAARAIGLTRAAATGVEHTLWPWAGALGGVLLILGGLLVLARGRDWPGMSSRYDAPGSAAGRPRAAAAKRATPDRESPADLWKALDRGEDPTR